MTTSESKGRFFLQNELIRIDSHNESDRIDSNRELECATAMAAAARPQLSIYISRSQGAQQQTRRPPLLLSIDETDRQTDGRTDGRPTVS